MKSARIFAFLLACPFLASNAFAQASATATATVTVTAGAGAHVEERYVAPRGLPRPVPQHGMHTASVDFTILRDTDWKDVSNFLIQQPVYIVTIKNRTADSLPINVSRTQQLPTGWSSSICDPNLCHLSTDSSVPWKILPNASAHFSLNLYPALDDMPDSGTVWLRITDGSASDTMLLPFYATFLPSDPPIVFQWGGNATFDKSFQGAGPWTLTDYLENHAGRGLDYLLSLQDSVPAGWNLTFDHQRNPNSTTGNTGDTIINLATPVSMASFITNFSGYLDSTYQQPIIFTLTAPAGAQPDSAVIYLSVHPQTSNPADSANYRFVMQVQAPNSVAGAPTDRAGLAVTNAWPNPLPGSSALHLEILTDEAGPAKAILYDLAGTQKGTLDLGTLREGTNELQINLPSLGSGEYIIRVDQGASASEVVRINYIK